MQEPSPTPFLLLIGGLPGSGKTSIGKALARHHRAAFLDKDTVMNLGTEQMLRAAGIDPADRESPLYRHTLRAIEYGATMDVAHENLDLGVSAICVAPFSREFRDPAWVEQERQRARNGAYRLALAWVIVEAESSRQRILLRGEPRDAWKLAHWEDYLRSMDRSVPPLEGLVVLDNTKATSDGRNLWIDAFSF